MHWKEREKIRKEIQDREDCVRVRLHKRNWL